MSQVEDLGNFTRFHYSASIVESKAITGPGPSSRQIGEPGPAPGRRLNRLHGLDAVQDSRNLLHLHGFHLLHRSQVRPPVAGLEGADAKANSTNSQMVSA